MMQRVRMNRWMTTGSIAIGSTLVMSPAWAHHAMDGTMPSNGFEGFMAGLAHPVIGLGHFAFVIAVGCGSALLAHRNSLARLIPLGFLTAALLGTGVHLLNLDLPFNELWVAVSVFLLGLTIALGQKVSLPLLAGFVSLAGLFHGYAYGESIVGAEMTPLVSYLIGFTAIQATIAYSAFFVMSKLQENQVKAIGLITVGIGLSAMLKAVGL
jgi:urease accessory protein